MPALDTEAQFKFLLCCIKHSAAGKVSDSPTPLFVTDAYSNVYNLTADFVLVSQVNFDVVAKELNIVSKAAA